MRPLLFGAYKYGAHLPPRQLGRWSRPTSSPAGSSTWLVVSGRP